MLRAAQGRVEAAGKGQVTFLLVKWIISHIYITFADVPGEISHKRIIYHIKITFDDVCFFQIKWFPTCPGQAK